MVSASLKNQLKHIAVIVLAATGLLAGYWLIGKEHQLHSFSMVNDDTARYFINWLIIAILIQCMITCLLQKEDIVLGKSVFSSKIIWVVVVVFFCALFIEREFIYQYWEPMRIDFEQHMWVAIGRNLNDYWIGKRPTFDQYSIWAGQYNSFYGYFIAVLNFIVLIDTWDSYRLLSVTIMGISSIIFIFTLNKVLGKTAVIFFIACVIFTAYMNFASFYMKHHILMLFFYAVIMFFIFKYWEKNSLWYALALSLSCFIAFVAYIGCIYYLPIAVMAMIMASNRPIQKIIPTLIVATPTAALLLYLLMFPENWPSAYFMNKAIWHFVAPFIALSDNAVAQLKFLFIPAGIWGWLIQACFLVGLGYIVKSRQKETWIWLISLVMGITAMLTSWDREMGHNFIVILPYAAIASFGASQLWHIQFSYSRYTKLIYIILFTVGFSSDIYAFALSQKWMDYAVFDLSKPLNNRVWFFDDARKLRQLNNDYPIVIDSDLVNHSVRGIKRQDTDLSSTFGYALHFTDFHIYKRATFLEAESQFEPICQGVLLTDRTADQVQVFLGEKATIKLLDKYRPANPRYDYLNYQPEVFHALYEFRFADKCQTSSQPD